MGTLIAAKILGEVRDVRRFSSNAAFAAYRGTAPIPASSGVVVVTGCTAVATAS